MARLKVLVVDAFTSRGSTGVLTQSLQRQAHVLLHALLADLGAMPEVEVMAVATLDVSSGQAIYVSIPGADGGNVDAGDALNCARQATGHGADNQKGFQADRTTGRLRGQGMDHAASRVDGPESGRTARRTDERKEDPAQRRVESHKAGHAVYHLTDRAGNEVPCQAADLTAAYMADLAADYAASYTAGTASMPSHGATCLALDDCRHHAQFDACMQTADAVWPLAFESAGALENLSRHILRCKRTLLGSAPGAVKVAASKLELARMLAEGGVATVATYSPHGAVPQDSGAWVAKPDDGAGCLHTMLFGDRAAALAWIRANAADGYVLQRFVAGKPGSLSLVCCDGVARVLSCNLERVAMRDNRFHVLGSVVNGLADDDGAFARLAQQVATAMPSLWGYVGVDFILTAHGAVVLDVNPRLTAAYAGLRASIGCNPAGLVLDLLNGASTVSWPSAGTRRPVSVDIGPQ
jgi:predicted ATP-grasp superfamily ATP-dependent carboligase